ncbi:MAG: alpha/beta hydrolase [Candidatus Omnitrophota bacterium]
MKKKIMETAILFASAVVIAYAQPEDRQRPQQRIPDNVEIARDIVYATAEGKNLSMDIAYPKEKSEKPRPVVVWIHGGAWRAGDKSHNAALPLTQSGYFTASIDYRLSQEAIWPAQINDCKTAIRFLRAHAEQYGIDPNKIGVWGSSAGGHLAAMLGTSGDVKELEGGGDWADRSSRVQAVVDFFGPTNFLKMLDFPSSMKHDAPDSPESLLIGGPVRDNPDRVRSVDPISYVSADDPPFLIVHGNKDPLVPYNQSELLYEALKKAGVDAQMILVKDGGHGGWNDQTLPTQKEILQSVREFFDRCLK